MEKAIRLFEGRNIARLYFKYRLTYPKEILEKIFAFSKKHKVGDNLAVDLACGSGQSTFGLCGRFSRTVGVDISDAQIDCAKEKAKEMGKSNEVEFMACPASDMPFEDNSVDLLTCASAWHWLDPSTVFPEVNRVLKRPGILAVYSDGRQMLPQQRLDNLVSAWWKRCVSFQEGPYGNIGRVVENLYRDVKLPYPLAERHEMQQESPMTLEAFEGLLSSFGSYQKYCKQHPGNTALEDLILEMKNLLLEEKESSDKITDNRQLSNMTIPVITAYPLLLTLKT